MANVIADRLPIYVPDETAPPPIKLIAVWAGLKAIPMVAFCGILVMEGLAAESLNVWGIGLMVLTALVALGYAAWALLTGISLWHRSIIGMQGVVALSGLSLAMSLFFVGTRNTIWLLGFLPELAPLAFLGVAEQFAVVTFLLGVLINGAPLAYVFAHRQDFV